jgi:hypothetical protein
MLQKFSVILKLEFLKVKSETAWNMVTVIVLGVLYELKMPTVESTPSTRRSNHLVSANKPLPNYHEILRRTSLQKVV